MLVNFEALPSHGVPSLSIVRSRGLYATGPRRVEEFILPLGGMGGELWSGSVVLFFQIIPLPLLAPDFPSNGSCAPECLYFVRLSTRSDDMWSMRHKICRRHRTWTKASTIERKCSCPTPMSVSSCRHGAVGQHTLTMGSVAVEKSRSWSFGRQRPNTLPLCASIVLRSSYVSKQ
jgi:hypothetical protein